MIDWKLLVTVFGVIFVAELPDKTAVATVVLASRYNPWPVFFGSALALTAQSVIAIAAGRVLSMLPPHPVHVAVAIVFLVSAVFMWRRKHDEHAPPKVDASFARAFASTLAVVFIAEWGDLTQIGTAALAAHYAKPIIVFVGATTALWAVAALAVFVGNRAARLLNPRTTKRVAAVVFALVGVAMISGVV